MVVFKIILSSSDSYSLHNRTAFSDIENIHFQEENKSEKDLQQTEGENLINSKNDISFENLIYSKPTAWLLVKCNLCNVSFTTCKKLRQHLENHNEIDTLHSLKLTDYLIQCLFPNATDLETIKRTIIDDVCKKRWFKYFTVLNEYSYEMSISDTEVEDLEDENEERKRKYKCAFCSLEFSFKFQVVSHSREVHIKEKIPFNCERCGLKFVSIKMYKQHLATHCRNEHKLLLCARCPGKFVWPESVRNHRCAAKSEQKDSNSYTLRCCLCPQEVSKLRYLREHLRLHADGKTAIDFQNCFYVKQFKSSDSTNNTLFQQEIRNAFSRSQISRFYQAADKFGNEIDISDSESDWEADEITSRYKCELCIKNFSRRIDLLKHQKDKHEGMQLPYSCKVCKQQFVSAHLLQQHLRKECYNENRRIAPQCEICNTRFIWPKNMLKHKEMLHHLTSKNDESNIPVELFPSLSDNAQNVQHVDDANSETTSTGNSKNLVLSQQTTPNMEKEYMCPLCKVSFSSNDNLITHTIERHAVENWQCNLCEEPCNDSSELKSHIAEFHDKPGQFVCLFCGKSFSQQISLNVHMRVHMRGGLYKCTTCQKGFKHAYHLKIHFRTHSSEKAFRCEFCDKTFTWYGYLKRHQKLKGHTSLRQTTDNAVNPDIAEDPTTSTLSTILYKCTTCQKAFKHANHLKIHLRTHSKEKALRCEFCDKTFTWYGHLKRHQKLKGHTELRQTTDIAEDPTTSTLSKVLCPICGAYLSRKTGFHQHMKTHLVEKPYKCELCSASFARRYHLTNHVRVHTKEKPFKCSQCEKSFAVQQLLKNHIRIHTGERPYECKICKKTFRLSCRLSLHMRIHTGKKPFKCETCGQEFLCGAYLKKHCQSKKHIYKRK